MPNIDEMALDEALKKDDYVERDMVELAIFHINHRYTQLKKRVVKRPIDFEEIIEDALEHCDLLNLFDTKPYKSALGRYYNARRRLLAEQDAADAKKIGEVHFVSDQSVVVQASKRVQILFKALKPEGYLDFSEVDNGNIRCILRGESSKITKNEWWKAKQQALAVMNSRRK